MNTYILNKLNELKSKGIINEEEYLKLKNETSNRYPAETDVKINWKNCGIAFMCAFGIYGLFYIAVVMTDMNKNIIQAISYVIAGIVGYISYKLKTDKYKNGYSPVVAIIVIGLLGPIALWCIIYDWLQIKGGHRELKSPENTETSPQNEVTKAPKTQTGIPMKTNGTGIKSKSILHPKTQNGKRNFFKK